METKNGVRDAYRVMGLGLSTRKRCKRVTYAIHHLFQSPRK